MSPLASALGERLQHPLHNLGLPLHLVMFPLAVALAALEWLIQALETRNGSAILVLFVGGILMGLLTPVSLFYLFVGNYDCKQAYMDERDKFDGTPGAASTPRSGVADLSGEDRALLRTLYLPPVPPKGPLCSRRR